MNIPSGNVTFLFTDIEGSTKLAQKNNETYLSALDKHHEILNEIIDSNNGFVFKIIGDAFCCAFDNAVDAVNAAVDVQIKLNSLEWKDSVIKVRMGIHTGNSEWSGKDYMGYVTLARTQRVVSAAYGGQVLISTDAYGNLKETIPEEISFRDLGERRLKDLIQPMKLYQIVSSQLTSDFPPLKTLDARPNNLPIQITNFIGREKEMEEIKKLLLNRRLLTLIGPGGTGKTRLSMQVAADLIDEFENGVWVVELAPLLDPVLIPLTIARSLGIKEQPNQEIENTLVNNLKDKEILIILDNCEHLIEACAKLTEKLLHKSPMLKIIATSREALCCEGEVTHKVLSLAHPDPKEIISPEKLTQYEAVRLFIERALAVNSNFRVNNENAPALSQICFQLDGIPLAIELAAARINVLTLEVINERLDDRFKLLTGGKRTSLPRQQTLRALIDWSYELLSENEKILFARLSVFRGGWDLKSAEEICTGDGLEDYEVLDLMTQLIQKSLIEAEPEKEKFKMLETIRKYSLEKLTQSGEIETLEAKHLNYFLKYSLESESLMKDKSNFEGIHKTDKQIENIRSAIEYSLRKNKFSDALIISTSLFEYWYKKSYYSEGKDFIFKSLEDPQNSDEVTLSKAYNALSFLLCTIGDYDSAINFSNKGLSVAKKLNDKDGIAKAYNTLGNIMLEQADYEKAKEYFEISGKLYKETSNKDGLLGNYINTGNYWYYKKQYENTLKYYEKAENLYKDTNDTEGLATIYHNKALVNQNLGNLKESIELHEKSLELRNQIGNKDHIALSFHSIGTIYSELDDLEKAEDYFERSLMIYESIGSFSGITDVTFSLGLLNYQKKEISKVEYFHKVSLKTALTVSDYSSVAINLEAFARLKADEMDYELAAILLGKDKAIREDKNLIFESEADSTIDVKILEEQIRKNYSEEKFLENYDKGKEFPLRELVRELLND